MTETTVDGAAEVSAAPESPTRSWTAGIARGRVTRTVRALGLTVGRRVLSGILVLWGAATLTFLALHVPKGDPAIMLLGGSEANPTPEVLAQVRAEWGFDRPIWEQYARYFGRLLSGDLGTSYQQRMPVADAIGIQLGPTVVLAFTAAGVSVVLAIVVALATAKRGRVLTGFASGTGILLASIPGFVLGILLLFLFAALIPIFPSSGTDGIERLVLPVLTLALPIAATLAQVMRTELDEVLEQPFILTARTRGLSVTAVKIRHALRHSLVPIATMTGFVIANLLGGAVLVETVFSRQGIGRLALAAVQNQDLPLVLGVVLFAALVFVVVNLVVDVLYSVIDPRLATA
ncbi:ABC transporter permease [Agromyces larvae]|uniref:ABC transporter permease n=1 Tax=Agromyces larvae TaxID=2929802 RepID=A0ABY4BW11_9MICO|nr:ABC transporter permease [Agromyces larvae]UOE43354.1 ABC transporter permease [Agromyces larvae]